MSLLARRNRRHRQLLEAADEDPLGSVANLFDAAIVLSVGLMLAVVAAAQMPKAKTGGSSTSQQTASTSELDVSTAEQKSISRLQPTDRKLSGEGTKLGVAYQLKNGQIVYVPE